MNKFHIKYLTKLKKVAKEEGTAPTVILPVHEKNENIKDIPIYEQSTVPYNPVYLNLIEPFGFNPDYIKEKENIELSEWTGEEYEDKPKIMGHKEKSAFYKELPKIIEKYNEEYEKFFNEMYNLKSRCLSAFKSKGKILSDEEFIHFIKSVSSNTAKDNIVNKYENKYLKNIISNMLLEYENHDFTNIEEDNKKFIDYLVTKTDNTIGDFINRFYPLSTRASIFDDVLHILKGYDNTLNIPGIDANKAYSIVSNLESGKRFAVGDSETSFGTTQVQLGQFLNSISKYPEVRNLTGLSQNQLRMFSKEWNDAKNILSGKTWIKRIRVDNNEVKNFIKNNPTKVIKRMEGTIVRMFPNGQPGVVINNVGYILDLNELNNKGIDTSSSVIMAKIERIMNKFITWAVVRNALARILAYQKMPRVHDKFMSVFTPTNVNKNEKLFELSKKVAKDNLMNKISSVVKAVQENGYNVNHPKAYNIYQLIAIANASGVGRVLQFLINKKPFSSNHLHYLQRANREIEKISGIPSGFPPNHGLEGFELRVANKSFFISKNAEYRKLYFPAQYANEIKEGRRKITIRINDVPVDVNEIVTCMTYSGEPICDVKIDSKNVMSLTRIKKAFGKYIANNLEHKFGPDSRFVVIRFEPYSVNNAEDEEEKMKEVLIDKDGVKLTRKQIIDHYSKPDIVKKIMSRIKGNPILIYIGISKNRNILKRNHNGKPIIITNDDKSKDEGPNNYFYWVKRRLLSIHEVFGTKTNIGFVDLDIHGNFPIEKAKKYAKDVNKGIKKNFNVSSTTYQSGGSGLHIEFKLGKETDIDKLRSDLKEMLDSINEDWEDVTTGIVKGNGMRSDISTLHNKGSIRVPGAIGETYGKVKKPIGSENNAWDEFGIINNNEEGNPDSGALTIQPPMGNNPTENIGNYYANLKGNIKKYGKEKIESEFIWIWADNKLIIKKRIENDKIIFKSTDAHNYLLEENGLRFINDDVNPRGFITFYENGKIEIDTYGIDFHYMPVKVINKVEERFGLMPGKYITNVIPLPRGYESILIASKKKNILMIVAPKDFCEQEFIIPKDLFVDKFGFDVNVVSKNNTAIGNRGTEINTNKLSDVDTNKYNGIFIVGGMGMKDYSKDKELIDFIKKVNSLKKPIAMICHAPLVAANAKIIENKNITGWPDIMGRIKRFKGKWTGLPIEKDENIFTAIGPDDAENLAWVFSNFLLGEKTLGPAKQKYLSKKEAEKKLYKIWKIADGLSPEEEEFYKNFPELRQDDNKEEIETIEEEIAKARGLPSERKREEEEDDDFRKLLELLEEDTVDEEVPKKEVPKKEVPKKEVPKKEVPKKEVPKEISKEEIRILNPVEICEIEKDWIYPCDLILKNRHLFEKIDKKKEYKDENNPLVKSLVDDSFDNTFDKIQEVSETESKELTTVFGVRINPLLDSFGNTITSWPELQEPEMTEEEMKYFNKENLKDGSSISKVFENHKAWKTLNENTSLLQKWIFPNIILRIGKKWFDCNKTKKSINNSPIKMFNKDDIRGILEQEGEIEDLPKAKKYISEVINILTKYTNIFFSRENYVPLGAYLFKYLELDMNRIMAKDNDLKEKKVIVCSVCKSESSANSIVQKMEKVNIDKKILWSCPSCKQKAEKLENEDLPNVESRISKIKKNLNKYKIKFLNQKITEEEYEKILNKENLILDSLNKDKESILKNKRKYENQLQIPRMHTQCPNTNCPGQLVPLNSINWEDSFWKTEESKEVLKKLKTRFKIIPPTTKQLNDTEQSVEDNEEFIFSERHVPPKWLEIVPFICPHDNVEFRMIDVRGKGTQGKAGFLWDPFVTQIWEPLGKENKEIKKEIGVENDLEEILSYEQLSNVAKNIFLKKYWKNRENFYNTIKDMDITKAIKNKKISAMFKTLSLYDTVKNFSTTSSKEYISWLVGREFTKKLIQEGENIKIWDSIKNTRSSIKNEVYIPILQKWVDNMLGTDWEKGFNTYRLSDWLADEKIEGIKTDWPGTFFVGKIDDNVANSKGKDNDVPTGIQFEMMAKKLRVGERSRRSSKKLKLLRVLNFWKIPENIITELKDDELNGKKDIRDISIIKKITIENYNLIGNMEYHDFNRIQINDDAQLSPGDFLLVHALIIPGNFDHPTIRNLRYLRRDGDDEKLFENLGELAIRNNDDVTFWRKFRKSIKEIKQKYKDEKDQETYVKELINSLKNEQSADDLSTYEKKRNFNKTPEPKGKVQKTNKHRFVIQAHDAEKAGEHFDLRLENDDGTLSSWALPKHKLPKNKEKLLAVKVEDHPVSYLKFKGNIPEGYGKGDVKIYDFGTYDNIKWNKDIIIFKLNGKKEKGTYNLIKTKSGNWIITKKLEK